MPSPGNPPAFAESVPIAGDKAAPDASNVKPADFGNPLDLFKESYHKGLPFIPQIHFEKENPLNGPLFDVELIQDSENPINAATQLKSEVLEKTYGVHAVNDNGRIKYLLKVNGEDYQLGIFDATDEGVTQARERLAKLQEAKATSLENKFKVTMAKSGELVGDSWIIGREGDVSKGKAVYARAPRLDEMYAVEAALVRSQPSHLTRTGESGLKLYFLSEDMFVGLPDLATYQLDRQGAPSIYIAPDATEKAPLTEKDALRNNQPPRTSLESILVHEIAHNGQRNMGWDDPSTLNLMAKKIGWVPDLGEKNGWLLRGERGEFFKQNPLNSMFWYRVDISGKPLDRDGRPATIDQAEVITVVDMQKRALVKPASLYFTNPIEMFAEGMRDFRLGTNQRAQLLFISPELYRAVKVQDEEEVAGIYGLSDDRTLRFIREFDGNLVKATPEVRARIEALEKYVETERIKIQRKSR